MTIGVSCCVLAIGSSARAGWDYRHGAFSGQYIIYGDEPSATAARIPTPGDTKIAFSIRGRAARDLFDAIGPAPREMSRGEERCEGNPKIRVRRLDTIFCRHYAKDGYWCTFGFDLSTGLSTWGKAGDAGCD
ncbi:hypothetical protein [Pseudoduganella albidiflava]|nr:hypothetical protein [Pseudoduganella albidiflava]QBH99885.1 hypothetical protein EYF70_02780 [Pseudoduganella albidiflava]